MTDIAFNGLIQYKEVTPSDSRLVEVLSNSGLNQLKTLNLANNESWFRDPIIKASLLAFVKSQTSLVKLSLSFECLSSCLSSSETTEVFSSLCESGSVATLEILNMCEAANFDSDEACVALAQLIDKANALKKIDFAD